MLKYGIQLIFSSIYPYNIINIKKNLFNISKKNLIFKI